MKRSQEVGFGLDPGGYSTSKTVLAALIREGTVGQVYLLRGCPFSCKLPKDNSIQKTIETERRELKLLISAGNIAIDVPIDLQNLPRVTDPIHSWQLTKRPVDNAVGGMAPLASLIGHLAARFQSVLSTPDLNAQIGNRIFETYPKPALRKMLGSNWNKAKKYKNSENARVLICNHLRIGPIEEVKSDDDLDAIICAMTAIAKPSELFSPADYPSAGTYNLPLGYRLLSQNPFEEIRVSVAAYDHWTRENVITQ